MIKGLLFTKQKDKVAIHKRLEPLNYDHWTVTFSEGHVEYYKSQEEARSLALTCNNVIGIRKPLYD